MAEPHLLAAWVLLTSVTAGLGWIFWKSAGVDRLLALQLLGTTSVAITLLLAEGLALPGLRDLALVLGLLASVMAVAFVRYGMLSTHREDVDGD